MGVLDRLTELRSKPGQLLRDTRLVVESRIFDDVIEVPPAPRSLSAWEIIRLLLVVAAASNCSPDLKVATVW